MFARLFGVVDGVGGVTVRDVGMVPGLDVVAGFMMFSGFAVMLGGMFMMLGGLKMMRCALVIIHSGGAPLKDGIEVRIGRSGGLGRPLFTPRL